MADWVDWLNWAARQHPPGAADGFAGESKVRLVLVALARYANHDGRCHPAQQTVANYLDVDRRVVRSALVALVEVGLIRDTGRREGRSTVWQMAGPVNLGPRHDGVGRLPSSKATDGVADG